MTANECLLGQWSVMYIAPAGCRWLGQLRVTDQKIIFAAEASPDKFAPLVLEPVDCEAIASAFDLDPPNIAYDGRRLFVSILASQIEYVTAVNGLFDHCVNLTIRNNGSIQQFDRGFFPANDIVRAIRQAAAKAKACS